MENPTWNLWRDFCKQTNREYQWGNRVIHILNSLNLLPSKTILDVGCGTAEFTCCFKSHCETLLALDNNDYRLACDLHYYNIGFEEYRGVAPDIIFFKQSFHLIPNVWKVLERYTNSTIVILQAPKPVWEPSEERWGTSPLCIKAIQEEFKILGKETYLYNETIEYPLKASFYEELIVGGFTSHLRKFTLEERKQLWNSFGITHDEILYKDDLGILVAK
jgi:hypothetical protein